jgi:mRNA interferase MazF
MRENKLTRKYLRGEIYITNFNPTVGSEQGGIRPALIIQNDIGNCHAPTLIVAPITSKPKAELPVHLPVGHVRGLAKTSTLLLEQIRTVDKSRMGKYVGTLNYVGMRLVDAAAALSLGIKPWCGCGDSRELSDAASLAPPKDFDDTTGSDESEVKTLCKRCKHMYEDAGYTLRLLSNINGPKAPCDFCHTGTGFDYEVVEQ